MMRTRILMSMAAACAALTALLPGAEVAMARRAPAIAAPAPPPQTEGQLPHAAPAGGYPYLLHIPAGYNDDPTAKWPVIIFLHGSGERGDDIEKVKTHGPPKLVGNDPAFPFIVISPQAPLSDRWWDTDKLDATLTAALAPLHADRSRLYLTGLSLGGIATWAWASHRPDLFAAIAPVAALGDTQAVCALKDEPVWAFHGDNDPVVPTAQGIGMVAALRACGGSPRLTVYPETGHDSWTATYADPQLYLWFLRHHRKP